MGVPILRIMEYCGLHWGPLILGNYHMEILRIPMKFTNQAWNLISSKALDMEMRGGIPWESSVHYYDPLSVNENRKTNSGRGFINNTFYHLSPYSNTEFKSFSAFHWVPTQIDFLLPLVQLGASTSRNTNAICRTTLRRCRILPGSTFGFSVPTTP